MRIRAWMSVAAAGLAIAAAAPAEANARPGALDPTFGTRGVVYPRMNFDAVHEAIARAVVRRPRDGRLVAAGGVTPRHRRRIPHRGRGSPSSA